MMFLADCQSQRKVQSGKGLTGLTLSLVRHPIGLSAAYTQGIFYMTNAAASRRGVMLHIVAGEGLGDRERGEFPDNEAKKQNRNERNEENTRRNQTTFHRVSVLTVIALNLGDCCLLPDRIARNSG